MDKITPNSRSQASGRLLSSMGVKTSIALEPAADQVEIPATAVLDDGDQSCVFVQPDPAKAEFTLRWIPVTRRYQDSVCVRSKLNAADEAAHGPHPLTPLQPGQAVVTAGAVQLKGALEDLGSGGETPAK